MSLLVVGSVAFDSVQTPTATRENVIGGSAVYFSYAASYFNPVRLVGVVGEDWPEEHTSMLQQRQVDMAGLQIVPGSETFRWSGKYLPNMNDRETLEVHLNVFGDFDPIVPEDFKNSPYVFLANGSPVVQMKVLEQVDNPQLVVADTMDLWIREFHDELLELLEKVDGLVLNDSEAKLFTGEENLIKAGHKILSMGPRFVIVKKGEHGAMFFSEEQTYVLPAYPTSEVVDPTGAGDSFAGGMMGYLAEKEAHDIESLREALAYGTLVASYNVEDFSLDRMQQIERKELDERFATYKKMLNLG
ncbi:MAG: PfkB family carbohydrate kinase [Pirellulaceae bacterium]|nr:PfkB family carbohydrate kinase [Pirellulaceae bacterium]